MEDLSAKLVFEGLDAPFVPIPIYSFYPVSGIWGHTSRVLYYLLLLFSIFTRTHEWLAFPLLNVALTYSCVAAVQAMILTATRAQGTYGSLQNVTINSAGDYLSIRPLVWDLDIDANLGILLIGYLCVVPIYTWSKAIQHHKATPILLLWTIFDAAGMICAITIAYNIHNSWIARYPQFCFRGQNMTEFHLENCETPLTFEDLNETLWTSFSNDSGPLSTLCLCPTLGADSWLRESDDIRLFERPGAFKFDYDPSSDSFDLNSAIQLLIFVMVGAVTFYNLMLLFRKIIWSKYSKLRWPGLPFSTDYPRNRILKQQRQVLVQVLFPSGLIAREPQNRIQRSLCFWYAKWKSSLLILLLITATLPFYFYAYLISPLSIVLVLGWVEYNLWHEPQAETPRHVGQWAPLLVFAFILIGTFAAHFFERTTEKEDCD
jgi:hypothetical protein